MKGKKINIFERHGEKLFFLLTLVVLLLVLVQQFATGGMSVKVGPNDGLTISQGYDRIASEAEGLEGQIKSNVLDTNAPKEAPVVIERLYEKIPTLASETTPLVLGLPDAGSLNNTTGDGGSGAEGARYAMPTPIAPRTPLVKRYSGALDPSVVETTSGLQSLVGSSQPYDMHTVTIASSFDSAALRDAFASDPDGSGPLQPIPSHWWRGQLVLLDVEVWRQEQYEDGSFGAEMLVGALPGVVSARPFLDDPQTTMPQILKAVEGRAKQIARPDFYPVISGAVWSPPAPPIDYTPREMEARRHQSEISRIDEEIEANEKNLDDLLDNSDQRSRRGPDPSSLNDAVVRGVGGGGGRGGGRRGGRDAASSAAERAREAREQRENAIMTKITELRTEREEHATWLREQGFEITSPIAQDPGLRLLAEPVGTLKDSDTLNVWASDGGAEPGATYRYRTRLVYGNPFYGRDNVLSEDQRDSLAGSRVIRSAYSDWSEPITMDESSYYYMTRVSGGGGSIGGASSRIVYAEVYTFFYGFWRKAEVSLRPGDPIVGQFELPELVTFEFPPVGEDGELDFESVGRIPVDSTITRPMGTIVLDVRPSARVSRDALKGGRDAQPDYEAVLLESGDTIAIRDPGADRLSERRKQMRGSADLGLDASLIDPGLGGVAGVEFEDDSGRGPGGRRQNERRDRGVPGVRGGGL